MTTTLNITEQLAVIYPDEYPNINRCKTLCKAVLQTNVVIVGNSINGSGVWKRWEIIILIDDITNQIFVINSLNVKDMIEKLTTSCSMTDNIVGELPILSEHREIKAYHIDDEIWNEKHIGKNTAPKKEVHNEWGPERIDAAL